MCWRTPVDSMPERVALCGVAPQEPKCPPETKCQIFSEGLALCLGTCEPLIQDCTLPGEMCAEDCRSSNFVCVEDLSGEAGQVHDARGAQQSCDPGSLCVPPSSAAERDPESLGCCEPFCDITLQNPCPGQGQECIPYFDTPVPPEYANVNKTVATTGTSGAGRASGAPRARTEARFATRARRRVLCRSRPDRAIRRRGGHPGHGRPCQARSHPQELLAQRRDRRCPGN